MEDKGWIRSEWGMSETNRKAKYYVITAAGRTQLEQEASGWERLVEAVSLVLQVQGG
jgi:DNA-binding PadR family transcriptional regulator